MTGTSTQSNSIKVRKKARENLMLLFFLMEARNDFSPKRKDEFLTDYPVGKSQTDYFETLTNVVTTYLETIDAILNESSPKWNTGRMAKVDLAILRLAVGEILYMEDVPDSVAVNEAVELAKKFGSEESSKFVNGVLGNITRKKQTI